MNARLKELLFVSFSLWVIPGAITAQEIVAVHLQCESKKNPIGLDETRPALSWQLSDQGKDRLNNRHIRQTAYRVIVADDPSLLGKNEGNVWDSKKTMSDQSIQILYNGMKLEPVRSYYWKVMIWDNKGRASTWSAAARWQMGLLSPSDWKGAKWIGYDKMPDSLRQVPAMAGEWNERWDGVKDILPLMRKQFPVRKAIKKATVFICGLGQFVLSVNGQQVGDHFLDPGWTKYDKHALYVSFDLTGQLRKGENALGVMLGNGFYFIPGERYRKLSGAYGYPKMICRLCIQYTDGSSDNIVSDESWKTKEGPVTFSSIYGGEDYDARRKQEGWDQPGFSDRGWKKAIPVEGPPRLDAQMAEPLKIFDHFSTKRITQPQPDTWVYDLGQNASGIPYMEITGKPGDKVEITPSELLTNKGLASQSSIGEPVYFTYTLKGKEKESWQPRFMYYGFRYLQIKGAVPEGQANPKNLPVISRIQGLHTRNAAPRIGHFSCSNSLFNKTFSLIDWAIQSNTASIFTDCPHREKLGWLEEAHLVGCSIHYNYDIENLIHKVVRDMIQSQTADGLIPDIAPEYTQFEGGFRDSPEWGSTGILLPWYSYEWFGDRRILEESYEMMTRYAAYLDKKSTDHLLYFGLGDWYDIGPNPPGESQLTPKGITSTAIYYYDLTILARVATLLGKGTDAARLNSLGAEVRQAFNKAFYNSRTHQYGTGSQAANAMAVYMGLVDSSEKAAVIDNIVADIKQRKYSLTAGDIGYRYLLRVLDDAGRSDVIYAMNNRTDVPGYGYQLAHGATALTESWQAYPEASNNHFMLGHLMEWFYSGLGGIRTTDHTLAYREIDLRPEPVGDLLWVKASYISPYGLISSHWKKQEGEFQWTVTIPANTEAHIWLPAGPHSNITESGRPIRQKRELIFEGNHEGRAVYKVGSGVYSFVVKETEGR